MSGAPNSPRRFDVPADALEDRVAGSRERDDVREARAAGQPEAGVGGKPQQVEQPVAGDLLGGSGGRRRRVEDRVLVPRRGQPVGAHRCRQRPPDDEAEEARPGGGHEAGLDRRGEVPDDALGVETGVGQLRPERGRDDVRIGRRSDAALGQPLKVGRCELGRRRQDPFTLRPPVHHWCPSSTFPEGTVGFHGPRGLCSASSTSRTRCQMPRFRILTATLVVLTLLLSALAAPAAAAGGKRSYIVVLKAGGVAPAAAAKEARKDGASVKHVYKYTIKGYAAKLSDADVEALRADPSVKYVVRDGIVHTVKRPPRGGTPYAFPSWGIDRIDQRNLPLDEQLLRRPTEGGRRHRVRRRHGHPHQPPGVRWSGVVRLGLRGQRRDRERLQRPRHARRRHDRRLDVRRRPAGPASSPSAS